MQNVPADEDLELAALTDRLLLLSNRNKRSLIDPARRRELQASHGACGAQVRTFSLISAHLNVTFSGASMGSAI